MILYTSFQSIEMENFLQKSLLAINHSERHKILQSWKILRGIEKLSLSVGVWDKYSSVLEAFFFLDRTKRPGTTFILFMPL